MGLVLRSSQISCVISPACMGRSGRRGGGVAPYYMYLSRTSHLAPHLSVARSTFEFTSPRARTIPFPSAKSCGKRAAHHGRRAHAQPSVGALRSLRKTPLLRTLAGSRARERARSRSGGARSGKERGRGSEWVRGRQGRGGGARTV